MTAPTGAMAFDDAMRQGREALAQGRMAEAARAFLVAAGLRASEPEPAFARCIALLGATDPQAGPVLQDLLVRFPGHAGGWEELGHVLLRAGKAEAGLVCLRRAASAEPTASRLVGCGVALRSLGRLAEAAAALIEACRLDPRAARPAFLLGLCAQDARDYPAARAAYERALAIDAGRPETWVNLGTVLQAMGDLSGAKRAFGVAVRARPDTFGRVSQALTAAPKGELWLDLGRLRHALAGESTMGLGGSATST